MSSISFNVCNQIGLLNHCRSFYQRTWPSIQEGDLSDHGVIWVNIMRCIILYWICMNKNNFFLHK